MNYYDENTWVFHNGEFVKAKEVKIDLYSQSLHYGLGVFEGIRSYETTDGTRIFKSKTHYRRLIYSASKMHIPFNYSAEDLTKITYDLLQKNDLKDAYIRPLVYLNANMSLVPEQHSNLVIQCWNWGKLLGDKLTRVMISSYQRPNPKAYHVDAKVTGHYPNSILASAEAREKGYDEALLLDINGNIAEGPGANFFYEKDQVLYTPPIGNILPGITRATVLDLARELGLKVVEKFSKPEELDDADGAFFTGTAAEVAGIESVNGKKFKLEWEDTLGFVLNRKYKQTVGHNEYKNFALV